MSPDRGPLFCLCMAQRLNLWDQYVGWKKDGSTRGRCRTQNAQEGVTNPLRVVPRVGRAPQCSAPDVIRRVSREGSRRLQGARHARDATPNGRAARRHPGGRPRSPWVGVSQPRTAFAVPSSDSLRGEPRRSECPRRRLGFPKASRMAADRGSDSRCCHYLYGSMLESSGSTQSVNSQLAIGDPEDRRGQPPGIIRRVLRAGAMPGGERRLSSRDQSYALATVRWASWRRCC